MNVVDKNGKIMTVWKSEYLYEGGSIPFPHCLLERWIGSTLSWTELISGIKVQTEEAHNDSQWVETSYSWHITIWWLQN